MKRFALSTIFVLSLANAALSDIPSSAVWPEPVVPPGANATIIAAPRNEWIDRVQQTLNKTKGKHYDLIFDGDSITDNWQRVGAKVWAERYGKLNAFDFGIWADKIEHLLWRLQQGQVDGIDPKLVVLMIGTNNNGDTVDNIVEGISNVAAEYVKRCPHAHVLLLGIFPRSERPDDRLRPKYTEINKKLAALASDRVIFLDIGAKFLEPDGSISREVMNDFLHPTAKGYQIWADAIQSVVDKYVPASNAK